jgi:adenosylcobinamide-phosphate synthase
MSRCCYRIDTVSHWLALPLGFLLDQLLGDPPGWPHPVRALGRLIAALEAPLRRWLPERLGGVAVLVIVAGVSGMAAWAVLAVTGLCHPLVELAAAAVLIDLGLASRSLASETEYVLQAGDDVDESRRRLAKIVGRDTAKLSPVEIHRACIETVAENTTDAVVAPLFWCALGGPIALWVFKAVSTLDSTVGYRNARYVRFGWASARMDDVLNFVPARLTLVLLPIAAALVGADGKSAWRIGRRDGSKHPSPNAGRAEAAMAGALGVQLGGTSTYGGVESVKPFLGDARQPITAEVVCSAIVIMRVVSWLTLFGAIALRLAIGI